MFSIALVLTKSLLVWTPGTGRTILAGTGGFLGWRSLYEKVFSEEKQQQRLLILVCSLKKEQLTSISVNNNELALNLRAALS